MKRATAPQLLLLLASFLALIPDSSQQKPKKGIKVKGVNRNNRPLTLSNAQEYQVSETLRLLSEGDKLDREELGHEDFVLVIGNTGAGKTTMTKFLAQTHLLEAYNTVERFLIKDRDGKISANSTIVSKTIFPDLIVDNETDTAFYDLPGFQDTRNASVEIANSWFIKKVADRAQGIKLLFVVNYSSMKGGETRTDFKTLLEHGIDLVKNPAHFANSTALLVTKVENARSDEEVMEGIQNFLISAGNDLRYLFQDQERFDRAAELIEIFLSQDSDGDLNRIAFFRQPNETGPLVSMPWMMEQKEWIWSVISDMNYTEKTQDFGISISPNARLLSNKLTRDLTAKITSAINQTALKVVQHFREGAVTHPPSFVGTLYKLQADFESSIQTISPTLNRSDFFDSLDSVLTPLNITDLAPDFLEMKNRNSNLEFFEEIRGVPILSPVPQWLNMMREAARLAKTQARNLAVTLNANVQEEMRFLGNHLTRDLLRQANASLDDKHTLEQLLATSEDLHSHNSIMLSSQSFNEFFRNLQHLFPYGNGTFYTFQEMGNDLSFQDTTGTSPFQLVNWIRPIELVYFTLQKWIRALEGKIRDEEHRKASERMAKSISDLQLNMTRTRLGDQAKLLDIQNESRVEKARLEKNIQEERDRFNANLQVQTAESRAQMKEMERQNEIKQQALMEKLNQQQQQFNSNQAEFVNHKQLLNQQLRDAQEAYNRTIQQQQQQKALNDQATNAMSAAIKEQDLQNRLERGRLEKAMQAERDRLSANLQNQTAQSRARFEEMERQNKLKQQALMNALSDVKKAQRTPSQIYDRASQFGSSGGKCKDECSKKGRDHNWCHLTDGGVDLCSTRSWTDYRGNVCSESCGYQGYAYQWCWVKGGLRVRFFIEFGGWGYCS